MANAEWERLKEALKQAPTPEARRQAAQRFKEYQQAKKQGSSRSRPTLVSLGFKKTYPHAIPLEQIPEELERSPEFFELMGRIVK